MAVSPHQGDMEDYPAIYEVPGQPGFTTANWSMEMFESTRLRPTLSISVMKSPWAQIENMILTHEIVGLPLVIRDLHLLPGWGGTIFSPEWLRNNMPDEVMPFRDLQALRDGEMTFRDFLDYAEGLKNGAEDQRRLYGKDAPCPKAWVDWLATDSLPERVRPLNRSDMFAYLAPEERPETLMTYFGVGDTYTPCHKDPCASQGQNLMTFAAEGASSFWFFTQSSHADGTAAHFQKKLGTELDWEAACLSPKQFSQLGGTLFVWEQKVGDLVLVPRRSCHQVINKGGLTIKTSWSRMVPASVAEAIQDECPVYRRVCRPEVYRSKLLCYRIIQGMTSALEDAAEQLDEGTRSVYQEVLQILLPPFGDVLMSEWHPAHNTIAEYDGDQIPVCDFCGADIFESFFQCTDCQDQEPAGEAPYQMCATCYVEGRSCKCRAMVPVRRWPFEELLEARNAAAVQIGAEQWTEGEFHRMQYNRVFHAAVALNTQRMAFEDPNEVRRCSLPNPRTPHDTTWDNVVRCHGCNRGLCRVHSLELRRSHSSDEILDAVSGRMDIFHAQHTSKQGSINGNINNKDLYNAYFPSGTRQRLAPQSQIRPAKALHDVPPHIRLVNAASAYPDCRPIDSRSHIGFYDEARKLEGPPMRKARGKVEEQVEDEKPSARSTGHTLKRRKSAPVKPVLQDERIQRRKTLGGSGPSTPPKEGELSPNTQRLVGLGLRARIGIDIAKSDSDEDTDSSRRKRRRMEKRRAEFPEDAEHLSDDESPTSKRVQRASALKEEDSVMSSIEPARPAMCDDGSVYKSSADEQVPQAWPNGTPAPGLALDPFLAEEDDPFLQIPIGTPAIHAFIEEVVDEPTPLPPPVNRERQESVDELALLAGEEGTHQQAESTLVPAETQSVDRQTFLRTFSKLVRTISRADVSMPDAARLSVNDCLDEMAGLLDVRMLDLVRSIDATPVPESMPPPINRTSRLSSRASQSSLSGLTSASVPTPGRAGATLTPAVTSLLSSIARVSVQPSPNRPTHLVPKS